MVVKEGAGVLAAWVLWSQPGNTWRVAVGELLQHRSAGLDQVEPLTGQHRVLQGDETTAPAHAQLIVAEPGAVRRRIPRHDVARRPQAFADPGAR